LYKTSKITSAI